MADNAKLFIMVTHGPDQPEMATLPFVMAGAAIAEDMRVVLGFQGDGILLLKKGVAETVTAPGLKPIAELLPTIQEMGGKLLVGGPCVKVRGLTADDLVPGAEIVLAGHFATEIAAATNTLFY